MWNMGFPHGSESICLQRGNLGLISGWEDPLEEDQPAPVFLSGESPWTEEPGELQSMRSLKVRHNWATKHSTHVK